LTDEGQPEAVSASPGEDAPSGGGEAAAEQSEPSADAPGATDADTTTAKPAKQAKEPKRPALVVRYGLMGMIGRFTYTLDRWRRGQRAVIKSDRGMEIGDIVCRGADSTEPGPRLRGEVLRLVTHTDEIEERHLAEGTRREFEFCEKCIAERELPMKLVEAEHLFGGDRIIFYFLSESRVDFRALVRDLAREFQTRIEMRQIGVRDEARLLGDYERCGRPLCCRAWIKDLEPISMKMAKVQKATLDPNKISGRCGRLMCCLRYEHATYRELAKNLPRKKTTVGTVQGCGKVIGSDVVTQMVRVLLDSGTRINVPVESLIPPEEVPTPERAEVPRETRPNHKAATQAKSPRHKTPEPKTKADGAAPKKKPNANQADRSRRRRRSKRGGRGRSRGKGGAAAAPGNSNKPDRAANRKPPETPGNQAGPRNKQGT
jgi:cell fate regulator YaaT (PSP1 superfamily)